ncbi:MAG: tricarboxylate transporter, partial [Pseudomonadota bacterium]
LVFLLVILGYLAVAFTDAALIPDYARADAVFPMFVGGVSLVGALILLVQMYFKPTTHPLFADGEVVDRGALPRGLGSTLAWFAGLLLLTMTVGFILALTVFLFAFIYIRSGRSLVFSTIYTACGIAFMLFMAGMLNRDFPAGLLQSFVKLPWPFT